MLVSSLDCGEKQVKVRLREEGKKRQMEAPKAHCMSIIITFGMQAEEEHFEIVTLNYAS